MNKFYYVYVLLDPRKPGKYNYYSHHFDYEPYYVGKGSDNRVEHHYKVNSDGSDAKRALISELNANGFEPLYKVVFETFREDSAFEFEKELISDIGTTLKRTGPLLNIQHSCACKNSKNVKRIIDLPEELYELVMTYAYVHKIYKFGPALVAMLNEYKEKLGEE